jgi:branched-chain amino acid transport system ATP-binding protein
MIEHVVRLVMGVSDRVVVLDSGRKIAEGRPEVVREDPEVIQAYLGTTIDA